ncbi:MAG: glycosyltransferase family 39 protein [Candidatus Riflebacteria bacterium]|nr:glycosyltransferase family 39 protein [Candidatus Riflebacteria bacterium]
MSVDDTSASKDPGPAGGPEASTATPGRCVVVVLVCYALAASFYELPKGYHWDEGQIILDSLRLAWGDLPHLDYVYTYSGGTAYLNFLVGKLFGFTVPGFRLWTVCLGAILSLGLLAVARRLVPGWWACVPPAIFAFYGVRSTFLAPYANWYCLVAWVGLALALISYRRTGSRRALAWAGVAAGLAFACKQTLGAFLLAGALFGLRLTDDRRGPTPLERALDAVIV